MSTIRQRDARYWAEGYDPKAHDGRGAAALDRHALLVSADTLAEAAALVASSASPEIRLEWGPYHRLREAIAAWKAVTG